MRHLAIGMCVALAACGSETTAGPTVGPMDRLVPTVQPGSVAVGGTAQATVRALDRQGNAVATPRVAWTSANPAVATVDSTGRVTARAAGTTALIVSSGNVLGSVSFVVTP